MLVDLIRTSGDYMIMGILDSKSNPESDVSGVNVLGNDSLLPALFADGVMNACIAVGSVRNNNKRKELYEFVTHAGFHIPLLIHPAAVVSNTEVKLGDGVQIMAGSIVQAGCVIAENTLVNTGAIIEHDCRVGKNVHICPGAVICGGSTVGDNSFIGAGATVIQGIEIGKNSVVGAGSVVRASVHDGTLVKGAVTQ